MGLGENKKLSVPLTLHWPKEMKNKTSIFHPKLRKRTKVSRTREAFLPLLLKTNYSDYHLFQVKKYAGVHNSGGELC